MNHFRTALLTLALAAPLGADEPRGDRMLDAYFRSQVKQIADPSLADVKTRADWEKQRPELRRQFLDMMGLWPLPPRDDLKATITAKVETDNFTVEKLHFQSLPGLYVTANLYLPKKLKNPAPAVLYVCGHANTVLDKVSYGSKVNYQYHPAWFASNGYVCLILDTLQLGEIQGLHHGTYRPRSCGGGRRSATPRPGIECWNAMRALDYLEIAQGGGPQAFRCHRPQRWRGYKLVAGCRRRPAAVHRPRRRPRRSASARRRRSGAALPPRRHHRPLRLHVLRQHLPLGFRHRHRPVCPAAAAAGQQ